MVTPTHDELEVLACLGLALSDTIVDQELDEDLQPLNADDEEARERLHEAIVLVHYAYAVIGKVPKNDEGARNLLGLVAHWSRDAARRDAFDRREIARLERVERSARVHLEALERVDALVRKRHEDPTTYAHYEAAGLDYQKAKALLVDALEGRP